LINEYTHSLSLVQIDMSERSLVPIFG
jgi:hypothetical protein